MKQTQSQAKGRPRKADVVDVDTDDNVLALPVPVSKEEPKPTKKRALTKEEISMRDYHENMNEINNKMKAPTVVKSTKPREIDANYLDEVCGNAEPLVNLIERVFENTKYFEMSDLTEEKLEKCKMTKNDYYVSAMIKFQDHHLKPSKSKNAVMEYQVDLQGKEKFYNALFIEALEKQDVKSFYYVKKNKQSFYKTVEGWKNCESEDIEKIVKRLENRIFNVASRSVNMLKTGAIPPSRYGYTKINYDAINSGASLCNMPPNEKQLLEDLFSQYKYGLMESCNNERQSDILFKQIKQIYDPKAFHNTSVCIKYEKESELCETVNPKNSSDDEDEEEKK
jgi:hypothetical protein